MGQTRIGRGSKIDNLVQVAHNVTVSEQCIVVAQVGLSGSVLLGAGCLIGGQVGVVEGARLADGVRVGARSGVFQSSLTPNETISGEPAHSHSDRKREIFRIMQLPQLFDRVASLEKKVAIRDGTTDHRETG